MLWTECTALLTYQIEASQIEKTFLIVSLNTGTFIGCLLLPWLLSHFGRLKVFRIDIALICVGGALCSLASHFIYPGLFLAGLGVGGDMSITYTVFMEAIPKSKLKYLTVLNAAWSAGAAMSAFLALCIELIGTYEIKQWRVLVWISLVLSFYIVYQRIYLLESPMYLYTISDQRVYDVLQEIANINGNSLYRPEFELGVIEECEESHSSSTIFSKDHRKTTFILSLIYSSSCFAYYSLLFFTPVLIPSSTLVMDYIVIISQQLRNPYFSRYSRFIYCKSLHRFKIRTKRHSGSWLCPCRNKYLYLCSFTKRLHHVIFFSNYL